MTQLSEIIRPMKVSFEVKNITEWKFLAYVLFLDVQPSDMSAFLRPELKEVIQNYFNHGSDALSEVL